MADAKSLRFVLPIPPSLNGAFRNVAGRGRVKTAAYSQWTRDAGWAVKAARLDRIEGPYRLALYLPEKMRGDCDNRLKAVGDLLVSLGVTPDDHHARSVMAERMQGINAGECVVVVEACA